MKEETSSLSLPALPSIPPITSITPGPAQAQECSREESLAVENVCFRYMEIAVKVLKQATESIFNRRGGAEGSIH